MKITGLKDISSVKGVQVLILKDADIPLPEILMDNIDDAECFFNQHSGVIHFKEATAMPKGPVLIVFDAPDILYDLLLKVFYASEAQAAFDLARIYKICRDNNTIDDKKPADSKALFGHILRSVAKSGTAGLGSLFSLPLVHRGALGAGFSEAQGLMFPRSDSVKMAVIKNLISNSRRMVWYENGSLQVLVIGNKGQLEFGTVGGEELAEMEAKYSYIDLFPSSGQKPLKIDIPGGSIFKPIAKIHYLEAEFHQAKSDFPDSVDKFIHSLNRCLLVPDELMKHFQGSYSSEGRVVRKFYGIKPAEKLLIKTRGRLYDAGAMESTVDMNGIYSKNEFGEAIWLAGINDPLTGQPAFSFK